MKQLYIVRHAKSSWDDLELTDFERPLNERGKRDAPEMGKRLKEKGTHPDLMLSSPAKRALSTAKKIAKALEYEKGKIETDQRLYHAGEGVILSIIQEVSNEKNILMVFGHNPGLTDFVNAMNDDKAGIDNIPTCGVVAFSLDIDNWSQLRPGVGRMMFFDYPKNKDA
jgi:phosphohistidine phosphatase